MARRTSIEPLLPGSRDEQHSDTSDSPTGSANGNTSHRRASLDSLNSMPRTPRGLELAPTERDRTAAALLFTGLAIFLGGTTALVALSSPLKLGYFAPHAPLNALGITCFALGIASVQPPTPPAGVRAARLALHQQVLLGAALPAMAAGTAFMYYNKHVNSAQHFTTWHAWAGCTTVCWMLVQAGMGGASVWMGGRALGGGMKAKGFYKYHRISGYALIAFALLTALLGIGYSTWASARLPVLRFVVVAVGMPLVLVGLGLRVRPEKMRLK